MAGIRRALAENGGAPGGKGPGGMGTGAEARVPQARSPGPRSAGRPEPEPFDPPGPVPATAVEGIKVVPPGEAAPVAVADAAPAAADAAAAPLPDAEPADALGNPEPAPETAAPDPALQKTTAQKVSESQAAYQRVQKATSAWPKALKTKCVATDGKTTMSGFEGKNPRGLPERYSEATPAQLRAYSEKIGHDLAAKMEFYDGLDGDGNSLPGADGWAGKFNSTHTEKQLGFLSPNDPISVNKPMCPDCRNFFRKQATFLGQDQTVADPNGTWVYQPDRTVIRPNSAVVAPNESLAPLKSSAKKTPQLDDIGDAFGESSP